MLKKLIKAILIIAFVSLSANTLLAYYYDIEIAFCMVNDYELLTFDSIWEEKGCYCTNDFFNEIGCGIFNPDK